MITPLKSRIVETKTLSQTQPMIEINSLSQQSIDYLMTLWFLKTIGKALDGITTLSFCHARCE